MSAVSSFESEPLLRLTALNKFTKFSSTNFARCVGGADHREGTAWDVADARPLLARLRIRLERAPQRSMARSLLGCTLLYLVTAGALRPLSLRRASVSRAFSQPRMSEEAPDSGRRSLLFGGLKGRDSIKVGDDVIAGNDYNSSSPAFGVIRFQAYKLQRVYYQGVREGLVERVDVESLEAKPPPGCAGYTKYMCLYSSKYHAASGPVILSPTDVEVVRVRDEIAESAWLALPGLFWVWLAYTFWRYGEDNGGAFRGLQKPTAKPTVASDELAAALRTLAAD